MSEGNVKTKILIIKSIDWAILIAVFAAGVYGVLYYENHKLMALAAFLGLFLVNRLGNYTTSKIAALKVDMEIEERHKKRFGE